MAALSEKVNVPVENLMTPDLLRRALWAPPHTREPEALLAAIGEQLTAAGARTGQVGLVAPVVPEAVLVGSVGPAPPIDEPDPIPPQDGVRSRGGGGGEN